jgi:hypothetical protein
MPFDRRTFLIAGGAALLAGPAVASDKAKMKDFALLHSVAVISNLGDQAELKNIGMTVFGNRSSLLPIADWGLDALAVDLAVKAMSPSLGARPAPLEKAVLKDLRTNFMGPGTRSLHDIVRDLPADGVDAFLVLTSDEAVVWASIISGRQP